MRARINLRFPTRRSNKPRVFEVAKLVNPKIKCTYQQVLDTALTTVSLETSSDAWNGIAQAIISATKKACSQEPAHQQNHWISAKSMDLLEKRRQIPLDKKHRASRKRINRELKRSFKLDRESWWNHKAEEMEIAHASGNVSKLFKIIRSTGAKKIAVSENVLSKSGDALLNKSDKLGRWAEHFQEQFSWPESAGPLGTSSVESSWDIDLTPFSAAEVDSCIPMLVKQLGRMN